MSKLAICFFLCVLTISFLSQKVEAREYLNDRALARLISAKVQSSLNDKHIKNTKYCDAQGCVVVVN